MAAAIILRILSNFICCNCVDVLAMQASRHIEEVEWPHSCVLRWKEPSSVFVANSHAPSTQQVIWYSREWWTRKYEIVVVWWFIVEWYSSVYLMCVLLILNVLDVLEWRRCTWSNGCAWCWGGTPRYGVEHSRATAGHNASICSTTSSLRRLVNNCVYVW